MAQPGKSIQSKNVAAVAGLPSPAATHHMKKLSGWRKKALFLSRSLSVFLSSHLFYPMCMPVLNSFCSKCGPIKNPYHESLEDRMEDRMEDMDTSGLVLAGRVSQPPAGSAEGCLDVTVAA